MDVGEGELALGSGGPGGGEERHGFGVRLQHPLVICVDILATTLRAKFGLGEGFDKVLVCDLF